MHPDVLGALRSNISRNADLGLEVVATPALEGSFLTSASHNFKDRTYIGNALRIEREVLLKDDDQIINVLNVGGPITRDGGACSYGSREHRDWLMRAAGMQQVIGHVIIINSGGGSSAAKYDYEQAIDYIHSKGQKVIAYIDGMACSAAYALASMCDEIYVMNESNQVGCIGTMCAFYLQRHGDVNAVTQERYVELYAPDSPYKNREFREAAEENYDALIEELSKSAKDFKALVAKHRPGVTEEQLQGDTYEARDVMGTLVDGQKNFEECIDRLLEISGYTKIQDGEVVAVEDNNAEDEDGDPADNKQVTENNNINQNRTEDMSKEYPRIMAAAKTHALEAVDEAVYLHKDLAENVEAHLAAAEDTAKALTAKTAEVVTLNEKINQMEAAHAEAIEKLNQDHAAAMEAAEAAHSEALKAATDKAAADIKALNTEHAAAVAELNDKLAQAQATIEAKEAEIVELAGKPAAADKGAAPADNNSGASAKVRESLNAVRPGMTAKERREALQKQELELMRQI